ncbi:MAG: ATP phosphoribosyltransferase regulatory subunit [Gammaproteobacteria bacterium]|nr:ATP phosphoribosyltransferase regulatory subunit [Gammaproteobacteria bacterium]
MSQTDHWLLPEGIDDILPDDATVLEHLRGEILQLFGSWGYHYVIPPLVEYLDSLLTGSAYDLDLETFKVTDQLSGRLMGIRADITPQIARIDGHLNKKNAQPSRYSYFGSTLRTRGSHLERSRSPLQIGVELYGYDGYQADVEIIRLMLEVLALSGMLNVQLELGHVGIYQALVKQAGLDIQQEIDLFDILQRKALTELSDFLEQIAIAEDMKAMFLALPDLCGGTEVIERAQEALDTGIPGIAMALDNLEQIHNALLLHFPVLDTHFDLTELRGYHYKTGVVFAAFVPGFGREIARGGRYDLSKTSQLDSRPATGFSADLKVLARLGRGIQDQNNSETIVAPISDDPELHEKIRELRLNGRVVVEMLPDQQIDQDLTEYAQQLVLLDDRWQIQPF